MRPELIHFKGVLGFWGLIELLEDFGGLYFQIVELKVRVICRHAFDCTSATSLHICDISCLNGLLDSRILSVLEILRKCASKLLVIRPHIFQFLVIFTLIELFGLLSLTDFTFDIRFNSTEDALFLLGFRVSLCYKSTPLPFWYAFFHSLDFFRRHFCHLLFRFPRKLGHLLSLLHSLGHLPLRIWERLIPDLFEGVPFT